MERVYSSAEKPVTEIRHVAIAVQSVDPTQRHIGILHYGQDPGDVLLLDLAWHHRLRNDSPDDEHIWVDPPIHRAGQVPNLL